MFTPINGIQYRSCCVFLNGSAIVFSISCAILIFTSTSTFETFVGVSLLIIAILSLFLFIIIRNNFIRAMDAQIAYEASRVFTSRSVSSTPGSPAPQTDISISSS